jgi:hypothetical protein
MEEQSNTPAMSAVSSTDAPAKPAGKTRLRTLRSLDGRTKAARRAAELAQALAAELGTDISDVMRTRIESAAALTAIAEDCQTRRLAGDGSVTLDDLVRATSAARRAVRDLGLAKSREPKRRALAEYLDADGGEVPA